MPTQGSSIPGSGQSSLAALSQRQSEVVRPRGKRVSSQPALTRPKGRSRVKVRKKHVPRAAEQFQTGCTHHGMLEDSRRYDPTPARRHGGVPNPQAGELHYEHFQELDRNRDGVIDPFERVSGRLDIERDLANRQ